MTRKHGRTSYVLGLEDNVVNLAIAPNVMYAFKIIPIKIPAGFVVFFLLLLFFVFLQKLTS